nr:conserved oligomeric Golgi complex subunit 8-like [Cherax quadricarinatus]
MLERLVAARLSWWAEEHGLLPENQSGFREGRSTLYPLLQFAQLMHTSFENREFLLAAFLDLRGAFDSVSHTAIPFKLANMGLAGVPLRWTHNFFYTDGSARTSPSTTSSAAFFTNLSLCQTWRLDPAHSVLAGVLFAIHQALVFVPAHLPPQSLVLFSDSQSSLALLYSARPRSLCVLVRQMQSLPLCFLQSSDSWKDSEEFSNYIIQLASCGVEKLAKEGAHLREERSAILDQTRDLAYTNYKTFIHTADCSRAIYKDFTRVESHLEGLSSRLPNLKERVERFLATSRNLAQSRHLTSLTLTKHTQLLEILELPQLMDTCVRNGYYEEALEILAYVRRLEKKHTDIPITAGIVTEVQAGTRLMLSQLLAQLRSPLALPQCLKVIGLLRRLDVFTEPELRLKFLQARDSWFNGILKAIPKEDAYQHIIKVVEASRVHLFDIVTQYRAIFSDDDTRFSLGDPEVNEQAIFHGWILHKVNQFIKLVEKDLQRGVGVNLEAVLAQCMFFGQSFSRIGADFRTLLIPLFQKAALTQCEKDIRTANIKFDETLSSFSLMEAPQLSASTTLMTETQDKTRPPLTLMEFPPLAHYMNGLVTAFNTLRQCCPIATLPDVNILLQQSLTKVIAALLELHRLESSGFTAREEAAFQRMCSVVAQGLLPHVNNCLHLLYPLQQISLITGVPVTQLQREVRRIFVLVKVCIFIC